MRKARRGALDACFVAQHDNKELSVKWKDWKIWEMFTQSTSTEIRN